MLKSCLQNAITSQLRARQVFCRITLHPYACVLSQRLGMPKPIKSAGSHAQNGLKQSEC